MNQDTARSIRVRIVEIAPSVVILLALLYFFTPTNSTEALIDILLGLTVALIGVVIGESAQLKSKFEQNTKGQNRIINILSKEGLGNPMARLFLKVSATGFSAKDFPSVFLEVLWSIDSSYRTTMVASPEQIEQGHNQQGLEIQRAKIADGADIHRIFICEDEELAQKLNYHMREQQAVGIQVRYILTERIEQNQFLRQGVEGIGNLDFSIIDDSFTLTTEVDTGSRPDDYRIEGCELSHNQQKVREYQDVFSTMWNEATEISSYE